MNPGGSCIVVCCWGGLTISWGVTILWGEATPGRGCAEVTTAGVGEGTAGLAKLTVVAVVTAAAVAHTDGGATAVTPVGAAVTELRGWLTAVVVVVAVAAAVVVVVVVGVAIEEAEVFMTELTVAV